MEKIVALVDSSRYSESVCDHAAWFASAHGASLTLLHIVGRRESGTEEADLSGSIGLGARTALLEELAELDGQRARFAIKKGRALLEDAQNRSEKAGANQVTTSLRNGELIETINEMESSLDLIVIGKRGVASKYDMEHVGSNLERVARSTKKPVLVASREFAPIKKILIAFDGGISAKKAVQHVAENAIFKGMECLLLHAGSDSWSGNEQLEDSAKLLQNAGLQCETKTIAGQADAVISQTVEADGFDMLVMGAYGHSRIRNLIIGSTTTQMLSSCKVPVLLFR